MRIRRLLRHGPALLGAGLLVAGIAIAAPASAAPQATPPALAVAVPAGTMLTLPAGDGFRDTARVAVTARRAWTVDVLAVGRTSSVVLASAVRLHAVTGGYAASIAVSDRHLHRGAWTIRVRRTGHPATSAVAPTHLRVGSGIASSVSVVPAVRTAYPYADGYRDTVAATVTARDETGRIVPAHGSLTLTAGDRSRSVTVKPAAASSTVRVSVLGLRLGSARLVARVAGPAGAARTGPAAALTLAPTAVTKATVAPSATTVEPVVDGLADTVSVRVAGSTTIGRAVKASGALALTRAGVTVRTWALTSTAARTIVWDGRLGDAIKEGTYRFAVTLRGPEGPTRTAVSGNLVVSADHLPYRIKDVFPVGSGDQQGLGIDNGIVYVATDVKGGQARIDEFDESGKPLGSIGPLPLGHAAEITADPVSHHLYVANGGPSTLTKVFEVDPAAGTIVRIIDLSDLGPNGMVAFDPATAGLLVFTGDPANGKPYTVTPVALDADATRGAPIQVPDAGTPQGIEVVHGEIWLYTSVAGTGNRITRIDRADGHEIERIELAMKGEGEGLAYDAASDTVFVGAHSPNRVGVLTPVKDE